MRDISFPHSQQIFDYLTPYILVDVVFAAFQNLHQMFMKDTCMPVAHLNRLVEEQEHETKCVVFKLVRYRLSPVNQIDCIEQCIKSAPCFHLENNIVKNENSSILLDCLKKYKTCTNELNPSLKPSDGLIF